MNIGEQVLWAGEVGVVIETVRGNARVSLPSGLKLVPMEELEPYGADPTTRLLRGEVEAAEAYELRLQARFLLHAYRHDPLAGLSNARVEPKHHQVYVAHRVARKPYPRMILADEVGLGKTVEAGLVLKELDARGSADRVIVFVPANLRRQWQLELQSKFNLEFEIMDGDAARHFGRNGANPFESSDRIICSLPFATRQSRREQITSLPWDVAVFDEAHRVRLKKSGKTKSYELAEDLRDNVEGMLLLTATPMQLTIEELWGLIDLVEPGLYSTPQQYERVRRGLPALNGLMKDVQQWPVLDDDEREAVAGRVRSRLRADLVERIAGDPGLLDDKPFREHVLDRIADNHPLSDALVRNRRTDVGGFTQREAHRVAVELTESEREVYEDVEEYLRTTYNLAEGGNAAFGFLLVGYHKMLASSSAAIYSSLKKRRHKLAAARKEATAEVSATLSETDAEERRDAVDGEDAYEGFDALRNTQIALDTELLELDALLERIGQQRDSKARELVRFVDGVLGDDPSGKVLVFTQFRETQRMLQRALEARGHEVVTFNGAMGAVEKERAVEAFRRSANVLVSTEAGGEGRNLQFCHVLVNYDLPWNPMKVEQRIGRIDRIGQTKPVTIVNLANAGTIEERVLEVLEGRIQLFVESIGSLDPILGSVEQDIEALAMRAGRERDEAFAAYGATLEKQVREAVHKEDTLRDFALERNSFRRDETNRLLGQRPLASHEDLRRFVERVLRYEGGSLHVEVDGRDAVTLSSKLAAQTPSRVPVRHGTFDPRRAIREESWEFLAMGHPLVQFLLERSADGDAAAVGHRTVPDAPDGLGIEVFYEIDAGPQGGWMHRHVIGPDLQVAITQVEELPATHGADNNEPPSVPDWAAAGLERSMDLAADALTEAKADVAAALTERVSVLRERAQRVAAHRIRTHEAKISRHEATILEMQTTGDVEQRRIIPALKGRIEAERARIETLHEDLDARLQELEEMRPQASLEVVAVGLVTS